MNNITPILLRTLVSVLAAVTERAVYTVIPKQSALIYPYIHISDIFQQEDGPKTGFQYNLNVLIEVVHKDLSSLTALFMDVDNVLSIVTNGSNLTLDDPFKVMDCTLNNSTYTEVLTDTGVLTVGMIRVIFRIE